MIQPGFGLPRIAHSPYSHHPNGEFGSAQSLRSRLISPTITSGIERTTFQTLSWVTIPFPYCWVYDVIVSAEQFVAVSSDNALSFDVVVGYGATPGDPFDDPATDFASLLTADITAEGATGASMTNAAHAAGTYNFLQYSARFGGISGTTPATESVMSPMQDPNFGRGFLKAVWPTHDMELRSGETMYPVLRRGDIVNLRVTNTARAASSLTGVGFTLVLVPWDTQTGQE